MSRNRVCSALLFAFIAMASSKPLTAQVRLGAQGVGLFTSIDHAPGGHSLREGYLTQPALLAHGVALNGLLEANVMLNLEGLTLQRGELNPGIWGEGYVDRRHPHTYLHEAAASVRAERMGVAASLTAGRGFAPFGTDDPMVRGFVKYPANHHFSQILERWILIGALRRGPVILEAGAFNGDEPTGPRSLGQLRRFGDSWSARATIAPLQGVELQASDARVKSPELFSGGGLDQHKLNVSARAQTMAGSTHVYALAEYARTADLHRRAEVFVFTSSLAEATVSRSGWRGALRFENTIRPEEERTLDPFRSVRPPTDNSIVGRTRWRTVSAQAARSVSMAHAQLLPFVEIERSRAQPLNQPAIYDPPSFYGANVIWTFSAGMRVVAGMSHARMGRYGVAQMNGAHEHHME